MPLNQSKPILYLITRGATTERTISNSPEFVSILNQISAAVAAGIGLIQIREKQLTGRVLFDLVSTASELTRDSRTRLLVNDRADIAAAAGADGVHLTTASIDAAVMRRTFGAGFLIGASTHSLDEARAARDGGCDFLVFGPVFDTPSKRQFGEPKGLGELKEVARAVGDLPVLALGGISINNARDCLAAGASGIAGIRLFDNPATLNNVCATVSSLRSM